MPPTDNDPPRHPDPSGDPRRDRRRLIIAGIIVLGTVAFFYIYAILMFIFRWHIFSDPWKVL